MRIRSAPGRRSVVFVPFLLLLAVLLPSRATAQTEIYYSKADNTYGWCANQGSHETTRACARGYCVQSGGRDCQLSLECADGWAAIASSHRGASFDRLRTRFVLSAIDIRRAIPRRSSS